MDRGDVSQGVGRNWRSIIRIIKKEKEKKKPENTRRPPGISGIVIPCNWLQRKTPRWSAKLQRLSGAETICSHHGPSQRTGFEITKRKETAQKSVFHEFTKTHRKRNIEGFTAGFTGLPPSSRWCAGCRTLPHRLPHRLPRLPQSVTI